MKDLNRAPRRRSIVSGLAAAALAVLITGSGLAASAAVPATTKEPSISGSPVVGKDLTGDNGTWTGAGIAYARKWLRCDGSGAACTAIAAATETKYRVTAADLGARIRFEVTASNADGSKTVASNPTAVVTTTGAPASTSLPTITGSATVGVTLSATPGTWIGDQPITYAYQWLRCDKSGNACKNIRDAKAVTYRLVQDDAGATIRIKVTAKNTRGNSSANSAQTAVVPDAAGGGGGGGGVINLPGGGKSVDVTDVPKGERLIVQTVEFSPNPVRSRAKHLTITITVKDTRGNFVRNAYVSVRSLPLLTSTPADVQTATDGRVAYAVNPTSRFPLRNGLNVQFFVKAYKKGDPALAGISGTRLVQVRTASS